MTQILDQSDLTDRAARLVEAAKRAGADAADAVCVRGVSLSVEVRLGKIEETGRAEGDDFTLRVFVGRRTANVSANVVTDPAELAERAVAMARVAPEDPYAGLADADRLATSFPDLDVLDATIPSAAEMTAMALAAEDAARAVEGVTNSGGASRRLVARRPGARHLARLHRLVPHLALQPLGLGHRRQRHRHGARLRGRGEGPPRRPLRPRDDRPEGRRARRPPAQPDPVRRPRSGTVVYDPRVATSLVGSHCRRHQRRVDRAQDQLPPRQDGRAHLRPRHPHHRRSASGRAASPRVPSTARASRRRPSTSSPTACSSAGSSIRRRRANSASSPTATPRAAAAIPRRARPTSRSCRARSRRRR